MLIWGYGSIRCAIAQWRTFTSANKPIGQHLNQMKRTRGRSHEHAGNDHVANQLVGVPMQRSAANRRLPICCLAGDVVLQLCFCFIVTNDAMGNLKARARNNFNQIQTHIHDVWSFSKNVKFPKLLPIATAFASFLLGDISLV